LNHKDYEAVRDGAEAAKEFIDKLERLI